MRASIRRALPQVASIAASIVASSLAWSVAWVGVTVVATGGGAVAASKPASSPSGLSAPSDHPARPAKPSKKSSASATEKEAEAFLTTVTSLLAPVAVSANLADWTSITDVTPEHTGQRTGADKTLAALAGSKLIIEKTKALLKNRKQLDEETARQLEKLLLGAAESPGTIPDVVAMRVEAEAHQSSILDGYTFCAAPAGKGGACAHPMTANQIDDILRKSRDLPERLRVWTASKEIGRPLKPGLVELIKLRNQVAREMGYHSYFALQVADYGMTVEEMMKLLDDALETTKPLFDGLHCFARYELAARFKRPPPRLIPAHWLGNRWAQSWPGLIESANLDPLFKGATAESIVKSAENFYVSLGFPKLPAAFWERSDLYPVPPGLARKKNAHASAWDIDRAGDVRSLMSVEPNAEWFEAAHHELGHIYYFLSYDRPEVPYLLRDGANRAFHEAVGELAKLASEQTPYLVKVGVMPEGKQPDPTEWLLQSALDSIVFLPFSAGTMSHFEHDLYEEELPPTEWQQRWWDDVATFQGVVPPGSREGDLCDACTKTHINDDPAQYYDYSLATMIKFQLHDHICNKILKQDVRACDYSGNKEVGAFLKGILSLGATRDWRTVIKDATGEPISPRAMMAFYQPLVEVLAKRNEGRGLLAVIGPRFAAAIGLALTALNGPPPPRTFDPGTPERVPRPSREGLVRAEPGPVHAPGTATLPPISVPPPPAPPAERERGVALGLFAEDVSFSYAPLLAEIVALGATHVALVVPLYQTDGTSVELGLDTRFSPTLDTVAETARAAKRDGLEVTIFPIVRLSAPRAGEWRGTLAPRDRDAWFRSYGDKLGDLAGIAAMTGAQRLVVGSELSTLDGDLERWRPVIEKVRAVFSGKLVYSANWDHYKNAPLFDLVDEEGISGYFNLRDAKAPDDDATAEAGWRRVRKELEAWRVGRSAPFIFTELGYRSRAGATAAPWDEGPGGTPDPDEQRRGFAAFRRAWTGSPILDGVYVWNWYGYGGPATTSYTPRGKPAEAEVRALLEGL